MKLKRSKAYKKLMGYLQLNFQFREPYQVLVDEEIVLQAIASKYDLVAGLERTLQGKVKVLISQCAIEHLYRAKKPEAKDAVKLAKTFERRRCGHIEKPKPKSESDQAERPQQTNQVDQVKKEKVPAPLSAFECIQDCLGPKNKHRYCVASQKPKLRAKLRQIPAVPLVYINRSVMILEPMSPATLAARQQIEQSKLVSGLNEVTSEKESEQAQQRKVKKSKEPNPLSIKKRSRVDTEEHNRPTKRRRGKRGGPSKAGGSTGIDKHNDISVTELTRNTQIETS